MIDKFAFSVIAALIFFPVLISPAQVTTKPGRARDYGIDVGILPVGKLNAITDVSGVQVGHRTIVEGENVRTGVTIVKPHGGNIYDHKVPAAVYVGNGFGKLAGSTQVAELGNIETPIGLTNTLSVPVVVKSIMKHTLDQNGNDNVRSVNAVVGETNDGFLNDIRGMHVSEDDVIAAIKNCRTGMVAEGCVGAGTGTVCFGYKGGIGTSSRKLPKTMGGYTVGVLVQTNFGGVLTINGAPVGRELGQFSYSRFTNTSKDGSCMIIVATDAPLSPRNLERLAKRSIFGMARTGSIMSNGSGDYAIAFSTAYRHGSADSVRLVHNSATSPLFLAAAECTEEAIYNSLFAARTTTGTESRIVGALPADECVQVIKKYNLLELNNRLPAIED